MSHASASDGWQRRNTLHITLMLELIMPVMDERKRLTAMVKAAG